MRLIGGRDYYDGVQAFGHDASAVFVRPKEEMLSREQGLALGLSCNDQPYRIEALEESRGRIATWYSSRENWARVGKVSYVFTGLSVYVCGKHYTGIEVRITDAGTPAAPSWAPISFKDTDKYRFFWDWTEFAAYLQELGVQAKWPGYHWERRNKGRDLSSYFVRKDASKELLATLVSRRITVATCRPRPPSPVEWRINGDDLGSIGFFKVLEPYAMFQEIEMWVTGVLPASGNPMVQITDDRIKIAKAGFDTVTSFRKGRAA